MAIACISIEVQLTDSFFNEIALEFGKILHQNIKQWSNQKWEILFQSRFVFTGKKKTVWNNFGSSGVMVLRFTH